MTKFRDAILIWTGRTVATGDSLRKSILSGRFTTATPWRWIGLIAICVLIAGCGGQPETPPPPKPAVSVATPVTKRIVEWDAYTGRIEAVDFVEVRSRVDGYLQSVHFDEGQVVNEGDLLFVIDPRPFQAELDAADARLQQTQSLLIQAKSMLDEAKAKLLQARTQRKLAEDRYNRAESLRTRNAASQEELDERKAEFENATANVAGAEAAVSSAESAIATANAEIGLAKAGRETSVLNLKYTKIRSPVTGMISRQAVTTGNLIAGGSSTSSLLTTITSLDPIFCVFDATERDVLKYMRLNLSGKRKSSRSTKNPVFLGLADENDFPHQGHMDFVDNRMDLDTASMRARCVFPNEDRLLVPGMFAKIRIPGSAPHDAVLIPDSAIGTDQSSQYVYVVVDGKIQQRQIETGPMVDGLRVIRKGLTGDESVVIKGLLQVRPKSEVDVIEETIQVDEDGLPDDYEPVSEDDSLSPDPDPLPESEESGAEGDAPGTSAGTEAAPNVAMVAMAGVAMAGVSEHHDRNLGRTLR